jgi:NADH-quinone oxidoreductase subunit E
LGGRVRLVRGQNSSILGLLRPPERPSPTLTEARSAACSARAMSAPARPLKTRLNRARCLYMGWHTGAQAGLARPSSARGSPWLLQSAVSSAWVGADMRARLRGGRRMSELIEPQAPSPNGHAGGDVASEELVGHGHFVTHFDESSLDYSVTETKITEATLEELRSIAAGYPQARSALLPMLHLVQSVEGRVTPAGIEACAEILDLSAADVSGVATFYTMYKRRPVGEYLVGVCTTALCAIVGGDEVYARLQDHLGIGNDETTADGKITLEHVECNAACDFAPIMMVNWEFFDNTTPEKAIEVVDQLRSGLEVQSTRGARVCTWKEAERVLAGFPDGRADEGPTAVGPSLLGLRIAEERGWKAPDPEKLAARKDEEGQ